MNASASAFDDLHSFADWPNLRYRGGEIGGLRLRDTQPQRVKLDEPSKQEVLANRRTLTGDAGRPRVKVRVSRRRLIVTATDGKRLDRVVAMVDGKRREKVTRVARRKLVLKVRLRRGRHRVQAAAADWTGNASRPVRRTLRVR